MGRTILLCLCILTVISILINGNAVQAGTTGKIAGRIVDGESGEPLPLANVIVEGTSRGAASDFDGYYVILNIAPGTYTLRASMIGYQPMRVENVRVSIDLTTTMNFQLQSQVIALGEAITVTAEREMVVKDLTATTAVVDAKAMEALPITEVNEALQLQAGVVDRDGLHLRGGRSGEIAYWIDGVPVTDVYDGNQVVDVGKDMVQEMQLVSGAFNAEYGQAMSGIVNIATKEGSNQFSGSITSYIGDYLSNHDKIFMAIDRVNPVAIRNIEGSLSGAIIKDKLFFNVNGRAIHFDGWLYGQRRYNPNAVITPLYGMEPDTVEKYLPEYLPNSNVVQDSLLSLQYVYGSNAEVDSFIILDYLSQVLPEYADDPDTISAYLQRLRQKHSGAKGDNEYVPMNWSEKLYNQTKLIYKITPEAQLSYNFIYDGVDYRDYERMYQYNPDGDVERHRRGYVNILKLTHTLSAKTFYELSGSYFIKDYWHAVYDEWDDPHYVHPRLLETQDSYSFYTGGTNNQRFKRKTETLLTKFDLTSQVTRTHQMKGGLEFRRHIVFFEDITVRPIKEQTDNDLFWDSPYIDTRILGVETIYHSEYTHRPIEFSGYLQDKMEFQNFIVNVGVRVDFFEPDGVVLVDESDPSIYNPIKPENRFDDLNGNGLWEYEDLDTNGVWDEGEPGEPGVTLEERQRDWYKDASSKVFVSPRIGAAFPFMEGGVIHFSYGHFVQIPRFERLYQNPDFELGLGTGNQGVIGNANLDPEKTVSGELGLQQQLTEDIVLDVTAYFRDIRDLAGTRADEIEVFGGSATYSKFINSDFGFVRGLVLALNKRFSGGYAASLDYTYQIAKTTNSDPEAARNAVAGGSLPEVQLTPMDWDQTHTVNTSFSYGASSWGFSLIGQFGSGTPYTPRSSEDISSLLTNSEVKPSYLNIDARAYKDLNLGPAKVTLFLRVFNLLDRLNEWNVFDDTGRAGFTTDQRRAEITNPGQWTNSIADWYTNSTHYSEPRRIEFGVKYNF
jgi:hypothetical protein